MDISEIREGQVIRFHGVEGGPVDVTIGKVVPTGDNPYSPDGVVLWPASGPMMLPEGSVPPGGIWHSRAVD